MRVRQVLSNLLSNALKFTLVGGVEVQARVAQPIHSTGISLVLSVCDTGVGIAPEKLMGIFSPFNQGDNSITRQFGGTGLGLAITNELVKLMGAASTLPARRNRAPPLGSRFSWSKLPSNSVVQQPRRKIWHKQFLSAHLLWGAVKC
jgi:signal transduction histidine kinase